MPYIVVLDGHTLNPGDLNWDAIEALGQLSIYPRTSAELVLERAANAEIILVNKQVINATTLAALPNLKFIAVTATGYNNVDVAAANTRGIKVANVAGYSTAAVAQQVFASLLALTNKARLHSQSVNRGEWAKQPDFGYTLSPIIELQGLSLGIYGFGRIGQAVAKIALAMGMRVLAHHKHPKRDAIEGVTFVDLPTLFRQSNVVSLHAPLTASNREIVNASLVRTMPSPSYLINTGRGGLVQEQELRDCLLAGELDAAALDVLSSEPPPADHPLIGLDNCLITPHVAWASVAARQRLMAEVALNIQAYLTDQERNLID